MKEKNNIQTTQEKELFQSIRRVRQRFNIRYRLVLAVTLEILVSVIIAIVSDAISRWIFGDLWAVPLWVDLIIIALFVGIFATIQLSRWSQKL